MFRPDAPMFANGSSHVGQPINHPQPQAGRSASGAAVPDDGAPVVSAALSVPRSNAAQRTHTAAMTQSPWKIPATRRRCTAGRAAERPSPRQNRATRGRQSDCRDCEKQVVTPHASHASVEGSAPASSAAPGTRPGSSAMKASGLLLPGEALNRAPRIIARPPNRRTCGQVAFPPQGGG